MHVLILFLACVLQDATAPYVPLNKETTASIRSLSSTEKFVAAYYYSSFDEDLLAHHPKSDKNFGGQFADWHRLHLSNMLQASIDICLPANEDLGPMVEALEKMAQTPKIGMHLDTAFFSGVDLTKADGQTRLYRAVRDFFAQIPPRFWAVMDERPLIWLGSAKPFSRYDAASFAEFRKQFSHDFAGRSPYLVAHVSWDPDRVKPDLRFGSPDLAVMTATPGGGKREEGNRYQRDWYIAMRRAPKMVVINSWNGYHDASEVCESKEEERKYIDFTSEYARKFKRGASIVKPKGKYSGKPAVGWSFRYRPNDEGLRPVDVEDGPYTTLDLRGGTVLTLKKYKESGSRYLYFDVDDSFAFWEKRPFLIEVEYLDAGQGKFSIQYDSGDKKRKGPKRFYKSTEEHGMGGTGDWKTAQFEVPDAYFANRQNGKADFRLVIQNRGLTVRLVRLISK